MIENFIYNDIVLYCKGWYTSKDNDIIKDLGYLFSKIYAWTPKTEEEVARMMMRVLDKLYEESGKTFIEGTRFSFATFYDEIKRTMWLYNISFSMAIIIIVKSILFELTKDEIKLNPPHYGKKEHFRLGYLFSKEAKISTTYKEMNDFAQKWFNNNKK